MMSSGDTLDPDDNQVVVTSIFKSDNCDTMVLKYLNKAVEVHMKDRLEICEKKIQKDILLRLAINR